MAKKEKLILAGAGCLVGVIAVLLTVFGNPGNMGFCIACFIRDIAGSLGLHSAANFQYMRPEIIGLILGSFIISVIFREFKPRGGSSLVIRFVLGALVTTGALVFLGCPLRMVLRLAGGDLNALVGLVGFLAGIGIGVLFLKNGFSLGRSYTQTKMEGAAISAAAVIALVLLVAFPTVLLFSAEGPGAATAPIVVSLIAGLLVGAAAQRSRLCMAGGLRDLFLFKDATLVCAFIGIFVAALIANLIAGKFNLGFEGQPAAHTDWLWNFLGMLAVGLGSSMLGGCPLRQLILAGEGSCDSAVTVFGMLVGAALCHNLKIASSGTGTTPNGRVACIFAIVVMLVIGVVVIMRTKKAEQKKKEN